MMHVTDTWLPMGRHMFGPVLQTLVHLSHLETIVLAIEQVEGPIVLLKEDGHAVESWKMKLSVADLSISIEWYNLA